MIIFDSTDTAFKGAQCRPWPVLLGLPTLSFFMTRINSVASYQSSAELEDPNPGSGGGSLCSSQSVISAPGFLELSLENPVWAGASARSACMIILGTS